MCSKYQEPSLSTPQALEQTCYNARKQKQLKIGFSQVMQAVEKDQAALVIKSADSDLFTQQLIRQGCADNDIPLYTVSDRHVLAAWCGQDGLWGENSIFYGNQDIPRYKCYKIDKRSKRRKSNSLNKTGSSVAKGPRREEIPSFITSDYSETSFATVDTGVSSLDQTYSTFESLFECPDDPDYEYTEIPKFSNSEVHSENQHLSNFSIEGDLPTDRDGKVILPPLNSSRCCVVVICKWDLKNHAARILFDTWNEFFKDDDNKKDKQTENDKDDEVKND